MNDHLSNDSQKNVTDITVYNLIGQKVLNQCGLIDGKVDTNLLPSGTYIFRLNFEQGETETFKIVKK